MPEKFYVTTPIYYVNARPHIGHAYSTIVADVLARRHRLLGDDTFFLTGTDEHGQKIERSAAIAGIAPQQFADEVSASFEKLWKRMGITNNDFIRTTSDAHKRGAQKLFVDLHARGQIYLSSYTGQYSVGEEMFVEGPPGTIGPDGKPTETVTEENFFFRLSDYQLPLLDLIESNTLYIQPETRKNEVLSFLRGNLDDAANAFDFVNDPIRDVAFDEAFSDKPVPTRQQAFELAKERGLIRYSSPSENFPNGNLYAYRALRDLSISRSSFTWGIPVPEEVQRAARTTQSHVIYVWLDALANYMTALGYGSEEPDETAKFKHYWPANLHLVGKEIIRFHCVYWPAFLLALNPKLQHGLDEPTPVLSFEEHKEWAKDWLPKAVTAHGWLLFDDSKMSKSKGNVVRAETILDAFGEHVYKKQFPDSTKEQQDLFATDVLRYFLLREIPFGQDGSFSFDALWTRYNADLTNGYGNLVRRVTMMVSDCFEDRVPPGQPHNVKNWSWAQWLDYAFKENPSGFILSDQSSTSLTATTMFDLIEKAQFLLDLPSKLSSGILSNAFLAESQLLIKMTDDYFSKKLPWKIAKVRTEESTNLLAEILYTAAESIRIITALLYPILPYATAQVWSQLGLGDIETAAKNGELKNLQWGGLKPGTKLGPLSPIFPRAPKELAQIMTDKEAANAAPKPPSPTLIDETAPAPEHPDTNHPGAGPRTASLPDPNPGATVGGSGAVTTERTHTPHAEAAASGIFAADNATPQIAIDDFLKVDLRVAQVLVAERIPKADKLLRLEVDLGPDFPKRQILSGIAEWYSPEELLGRRIVIVANLAPRKMRGLESHGMLLAASAGDNTKPILTTFGEDLPLGSRVR